MASPHWFISLMMHRVQTVPRWWQRQISRLHLSSIPLVDTAALNAAPEGQSATHPLGYTSGAEVRSQTDHIHFPLDRIFSFQLGATTLNGDARFGGTSQLTGSFSSWPYRNNSYLHGWPKVLGARKYSSGGGLVSLPVEKKADLMFLLNQQEASLDVWSKIEHDITDDALASGLLKPLIALHKELAELRSILDDSQEDADMKSVAKEELEEQTHELERMRNDLIDQLLARDGADEGGCILEVRAGTGGDEAALFALEIFTMYEILARGQGWKFEVLDVNSTDLKGCKEASAAVSGRGAYGRFKFEIGVHRVQRVPVTEKSGRIHTSAISVAVLPEASEVDVRIRDEDLRIDTYRSGGSGGQSVNTTSSAVRVTHVPSGVVVAIQDERSQHKNKAKALKILRARLYDLERQKLATTRSEQRSEQIGSGDRSERIRTYNFPQGRVTDHRVGITQHNLDRVLATGDLEEFVEALVQKQREDSIAALLRVKQASGQP